MKIVSTTKRKFVMKAAGDSGGADGSCPNEKGSRLNAPGAPPESVLFGWGSYVLTDLR
jgi:hypothetical protein